MDGRDELIPRRNHRRYPAALDRRVLSAALFEVPQLIARAISPRHGAGDIARTL